jgi:murein DD-endopeptidase MepM/ murein hydrolase activator NlpD
VLPADGFIGLMYGDPRGPYSEVHRHQGIDIFSPTEPGITPVYAAYDGYITREEGWTSALIERVPDDPLQPGRQIWLYYTHMATADGQSDFIEGAFPHGTHDVLVKQGTLLGYTGNYSGNPVSPVAVHLHFSIVLDNGQGGYRNELDFNNTVDPSRYLGMAVNYGCAFETPACMRSDPLCAGAVLGLGGG